MGIDINIDGTWCHRVIYVLEQRDFMVSYEGRNLPILGGGEASKDTNQTSTSGKPFEAYETQSDDSWATILKNTGVTIHQQRDFLRWLQKH